MRSTPAPGHAISEVRIVTKSEAREPPRPAHYGSKAATADLQTDEVQDLADNIDALREATAGHPMRIRVTVGIGDGGRIDQGILDRVNVVLAQIKPGWKVQ